MAAAVEPCLLKILLVSANRCVKPEPVFPIGLAQLTPVLRRAGYEVSWLDLLTDSERFEEVLTKSGAGIVAISVRNLDDVLIRRQETFIDELAGMVEKVHRLLSCPVVLGGSGFSIMPRELLELTGADFGVMGEGEIALTALLDALRNKTDYRSIAGLVFRTNGIVSVNPRSHPVNGDELAPMTVDPELARHYMRCGGVLNIQTQRGCSHRCCYCTYPLIEGARNRSRAVDAVLADFDQLERLGARFAFIVDSVFNSSPQHVYRICDALARRKSKISWGCFLRPQGLSRDLVELMVRAGLSHVEFGSDSFCDEVLSAYRKDLTFEDIRVSNELIRAEAIDCCHFVIAGGPGETPQTLELGFKNSQRLGGSIIMAVPGMRIYPGTQLFQQAIADGQLSRSANLMRPAYYLAPGLDLEAVLDTLKAYAKRSPNWVVGNSDQSYETLVTRLRQRGVTGPLWQYFAAAQRLAPQQPETGNSQGN